MAQRLMRLGLLLLLLSTGAVYADWFPDQPHKMHFPQLPNVVGWDVNATEPVVLADDWMCTDSGWVKEIHFWGSWMHGIEGQIIAFNLSIHADIPADPPDIPFSRPGEPLWERQIADFVVAPPFEPPGPEGWYDPSTGMIMPDDHFEYWQYNVFLDSLDWFWQEEGTIYWLNIMAIVADPGTQWGWKSTLDRWNDDGVWSFIGEFNWIDLWEPPDFIESLNLAFVISPGPEPVGACCYPDPGGLNSLCVQTTQDYCVNNLGGVYQGDGTVCGGTEACCLPDGSCLDADALCCVNELGGTPQGAGTQCSVPQACCFSDGSCQNYDPLCCDDMGGTPQGTGTSCTGVTIACCFPDNTCLAVEPLCCDEMGGTPSPIGSPTCLGDGDGDGIDDACQGGWNPGDPHKMHYPQLPNEFGWDVNATFPVVLADDFRCSESGWIKDIHFWGSWMHDIEGQIISFNLSIHSDMPYNPPMTPFSHPLDMLWEREITQFGVVPMAPLFPEGWYDPTTMDFFPDDHISYFQYNVFLDSLDWFWQEAGTVYWLNISATVADPGTTQWGWKSTLDRWNDDAVWAFWGEPFWIDMWEPPFFDTSLNLAFVITGEGYASDTCTYYKDPYNDYAPAGMPDFDQKQDVWMSPWTGNWSWCGPVALANCLWWFDSKLEDPTSPPPPTISDSYPLVSNFGNPWDDHDPQNLIDFVGMLGPMCNVDGPFPGTFLPELEMGLQWWLSNQGLENRFSSYISMGPQWEEIRDSVLSCQDVILLLGFYELQGTQCMQWLGGHYVTTAGVCVEDTAICVSDPMFDLNEGEPPAGSAHGSAVHNDAAFVSGPHGTMHHDKYYLIPNPYMCPTPAAWMLANYPSNWTDLMVFAGENPIDPWPMPTYGGGPIVVLLDAALIICPVPEEPEACCLPDGQCVMQLYRDCWDLGGTPQGPGTSCTAPEACCFADGSCTMVDPLCCDDLGGSPQGAGTSCSTPEACCFDDGNCIMADPICCTDLGGVPQGPGTACTTPEACCLPSGQCIMADPLCCDEAGGVPQGPGTTCSAPEACCLPNGQCVMADPICCDELGGVPQGSGTECTTLEACCLADSQCVMADPLCCDDLGGVPQGPGTQCGGLGACCFPDGQCAVIDSICCDNLGGVPQGSGTECTTPEACCLPDSQCVMLDPLCCVNLGGLPQGPGSSCSAPQACCLPDGQCLMIDPLCCDDLGGVPQGPGTTCTSPEACCLPSGACIMTDPLCCNELDGVPQGSGTSCTTPEACCLSDGECVMADPICCDDLGGVGQGPGTTCTTPQACCLPDSQCVMLDPLCCDDLGGVPQGSGTTCTAPEACCLPDSQCVMLDPLCCDDLGGVPQGTGTECTALEACCLPDSQCAMLDPVCCVDLGGLPQGPGSSCSAPQACCLSDGQCLMIDPLCCDDLGGTAQGSGSQCSDAEACCFDDGSCTMEDPLCCDDLGGTPMGPGSQCTAPEACCLQSGECIMADPLCCSNMGGIPQGSGTQCTQLEACCIPSTDECVMLDPLCCEEIGGIPQGPGTACSEPEACCFAPAGECRMLDPLCCIEAGGTPQGHGTQCSAPRPCCLGDSCLMVDPLCCDDIGGVPSPIGAASCLGDGDGNGVDDACEGGWNPGDPHKMHFPQLPDEAGWDVNGTWPAILADDWFCSGTGPVKDIHFWGSWKHGVTGQISAFTLRVYSDIPAEQSPTGYSMPGELLWQYTEDNPGIVPIDPPTAEGWYDPMTEQFYPGDHNTYFQYNIYLDSLDWFYQEMQSIYWLSITAYVTNPETQWGWKSSIEHFNDDAVWSATEPPSNWSELYEPPDFVQSLDLAFVITEGGVCDCIPGDADGNMILNISDAVYLISYIFGGGPAPVPYSVCNGDADCNCIVNISDAVFMITYIFGGGPAPCTCEEWLAACGPPLY